ncbi:hypothetical protein F1735_13030 [Massilia sp. CCM 8694]|uniref:Phasin domain-containing protein n=1 Tax=Massilia genomosp. 1 TaxID=2609280 RepID=A0ABX0MUR0_9BURK|nr:hypothetical protein [Massilia genomosp. 1]
MSHAAPDLASISVPGHADLTCANDAIDSAATAITQAAMAADRELDANCKVLLQTKVEAAAVASDAHHELLETCAAAHAAAYASIDTGIQAVLHSDAQARSSLHEAQDGLQQALEALSARHREHLAAMGTELGGVGNGIGNELTPGLLATLGALGSDVDTYLHTALDTLEQRAKGVFSTAAESYMDAADQAANAFCDSLEASTRELAAFAAEGIASTIDGARQRLQELAIDTVEKAIAQAIIETELNVMVTSALSSIMPELIAFHQALPALEAAVQVFKEMRDLLSFG